MSVYKGHKLLENELHCNKNLNLLEPNDNYMLNKNV